MWFGGCGFESHRSRTFPFSHRISFQCCPRQVKIPFVDSISAQWQEFHHLPTTHMRVASFMVLAPFVSCSLGVLDMNPLISINTVPLHWDLWMRQWTTMEIVCLWYYKKCQHCSSSAKNHSLLYQNTRLQLSLSKENPWSLKYNGLHCRHGWHENLEWKLTWD